MQDNLCFGLSMSKRDYSKFQIVLIKVLKKQQKQKRSFVGLQALRIIRVQNGPKILK